MKNQKNHALQIASILLFFSLILTAVNYFWIKNNLSHLPPPWDQSAYIAMSINDYDALRSGQLLKFVKIVLNQAPALAPLFPITTAPLYFIFGVDAYTAYIANGIYLFILFLSVFFITERLAGKKAAVLSIFLVATFPAIIVYSRDYLFEFPSASLIAVSYLFFLKSESFKEKRHSILFGIFAGLSVLTKTMGMVFLVMPFFYAIYAYAKNEDSKVRKNILMSFLAVFLVASTYYVPNFKHIFGYLFYFGFGKGSENYNPGVSSLWSVRNWVIYLRSIVINGVSVGYAAIFVVSGIVFLLSKNKKISRDYLVVWLWFVCGYILLSLPQSKSGERFAMPIIPPLAILMAVHLVKISARPLRYLFIILALAAGLSNYTYQTASQRCHYERFIFKGVPFLVPVHITCDMQDELNMPYEKDWDLMPILQYMDGLHPEDTIHVLLGFDHHFLNTNTMNLYATLGNHEGILRSNFKPISVVYLRKDEVIAIAGESHYIITKTGFQGPTYTTLQSPLVKDLLKDRIPLKNFYMSDGSMVSIFEGGAISDKSICNLILGREIGDRTGEISCRWNSVFIHPGVNKPSRITFALNKAYKKITMVFSFKNPEKIPVSCREIDGEVGLQINADGKTVYRKEITYRQDVDYQLDLSNIDKLEIVVDKGRNGPDCDWFLIKDVTIF